MLTLACGHKLQVDDPAPVLDDEDIALGAFVVCTKCGTILRKIDLLDGSWHSASELGTTRAALYYLEREGYLESSRQSRKHLVYWRRIK